MWIFASQANFFDRWMHPLDSQHRSLYLLQDNLTSSWATFKEKLKCFVRIFLKFCIFAIGAYFTIFASKNTVEYAVKFYKTIIYNKIVSVEFLFFSYNFMQSAAASYFDLRSLWLCFYLYVWITEASFMDGISKNVFLKNLHLRLNILNSIQR